MAPGKAFFDRSRAAAAPFLSRSSPSASSPCWASHFSRSCYGGAVKLPQLPVALRNRRSESPAPGPRAPKRSMSMLRRPWAFTPTFCPAVDRTSLLDLAQCACCRDRRQGATWGATCRGRPDSRQHRRCWGRAWLPRPSRTSHSSSERRAGAACRRWTSVGGWACTHTDAWVLPRLGQNPYHWVSMCLS